MSVHHTQDREVAGIAQEFKGIRVPFDSIPVIDLSPYRDGTGKEAVAAEIGRAARDVGFLYVSGHGIEQSVIDAALAQSKAFFDLPVETKNRYPIADSYPHQRGYVPVFGEELGMDETVDFKESFDLGLDLPADDPDVVAGKPMHSPNVWPAEVPAFKNAITGYHDAMLGLSRVLGEAIADSLDLETCFFTNMMKKPVANMRLLHYPPYRPIEGRKVIGAGAHSDYGFITILLQDDVGGLQVQNTRGDWIEAPPIPGTFVINIGEMLATWTNDLFVATQHRVMNVSDRDRYSIPLFFDMDFDIEVACLDTCLKEGETPRYPSVTAGEYILKRLDETFPFRRN